MSYGPPPGGQYPGQQQYGQQPAYGQQPPYGQPQQQQYPPPGGPSPGQYGAPPPVPYKSQPGYGVPSPQPYGAPPGQYAPGGPPPGQYAPGGPPPGQYGAPSPQPYGQAQQYAPPPGPPQGQYGAQAQGQYGAPPPHQGGYPQPQAYGQPAAYQPPQSYAPPDQPSPGYSSQPPHIQWDATADAKALRKAMKGFGTDEKELIRVLCPKDALQINVLRETYNRNERRDLLADLKSELRGDFEEVMMGIARGPLLQDCHHLRESMKGMGTVEEGLTDVLCGRNNADIAAIKAAYQATYKRSLESDLRGDLSMKTEQHFMMIVAGNRAPQFALVDQQRVEADVTEIYNATDGKMGTDEIKVCEIFTHRNDDQLRAIAYEYKRRYTRDLETVVISEFSGHMKYALLYQLRTATDPALRDAMLMEDAMKGMGTKERLLLNRVIRAHWNKQHMSQVQAAYKHKFKQTLRSRIEGETSGHFERSLVACLA